MNPIAIVCRPMHALVFVIALLIGYAGILASSIPTSSDEDIARVELIE